MSLDSIMLHRQANGKSLFDWMTVSMRVFDKDVAQIDKASPCGGSCGLCDECHRKASLAVATHVLDRCAAGRRHGNSMTDRQRRYLRSQTLTLLAALGIADGPEIRQIVARSEWGRSMRFRQLD